MLDEKRVAILFFQNLCNMETQVKFRVKVIMKKTARVISDFAKKKERNQVFGIEKNKG